MKSGNIILCHHCGKRIVWNRHEKGGGHWAHPVLVWGGKSHTLGNALMEQGCSSVPNRTWATPARKVRAC